MLHKSFLSNLGFSGCVVLGLISSPAFAQTSPLKAEMQVYEILDVKKQTKKLLKETDKVKPNTRLEYRVTYTNTSNASLKNLKMNLPIPAHVTYTGQAFPKNVYASTDGVNFAKAPLKRTENGKQIAVPLAEYRALQWEINEFKAKQNVNVSAQVRVNAAE